MSRRSCRALSSAAPRVVDWPLHALRPARVSAADAHAALALATPHIAARTLLAFDAWRVPAGPDAPVPLPPARGLGTRLDARGALRAFSARELAALWRTQHVACARSLPIDEQCDGERVLRAALAANAALVEFDGERAWRVAALAPTLAARRAERAGELLARAHTATSARARRYVAATFGVFAAHRAFAVPRALALPRRVLAFTDAHLLRDVCDALGERDAAHELLDGRALLQRVRAAPGASLVLNFNTPLAQVISGDVLRALHDEQPGAEPPSESERQSSATH